MTKRDAAQFIPLVQALAEGKTIEYKVTSDSRWEAMDAPTFCDPIHQYRIKPEPPKPREWRLNVYVNGRIELEAEMAQSAYAPKLLERVTVREVLPESKEAQ